MNENIVKIDIPSFQDMCKRITELEKENKKLKADNKILGNELTYFKEYSADLENEVNRKERMLSGLRFNLEATTAERNEYCEKCNSLSKELQDIKQMSMFEFGNTYCSSESLEADGHAFARSLLGKPATAADIAEETAIANGEKHYATFNGDDF